MNGGDALIQTLLAHGSDVAFGVPGESYLAALEAMRQSQGRFRYVNSRHEAGAAFAAEAYGKITGKPGIAFVTRGPGACNASIGVHTADQDATPMILFVGQVATREFEMESFQEVDYQQMFGGMAKAVLEPLTPARVGEMTARALRLARSGRCGPVVVVLPEDVLSAEAPADWTVPSPLPHQPIEPAPAVIARARDLIARAKRPLVIAGERVGLEDAYAELRAFVDASGIACVAGFRRHDVLDNNHPGFVGHFGLGRPEHIQELAKEADVVVFAGCRPDDVTSDNFAFPHPGQRIVHIYPDPDMPLRLRRPEVQIVADLAPALAALADDMPAPSDDRLAWRAAHREGYIAYSERPGHEAKGDVDMAEVMIELRGRLPADAVITNDAGNFSSWLHRYHRFAAGHCQLGPCNGAMGYAVPAAIGAQVAAPGRTVVAMVGDGGFLMTGMEIATALQDGLPIKILAVDNGNYGTIWMHQHATYGGHSGFGVGMTRSDLAAVARGLGAAAWTVAHTGEFRDALAGALAHDGPALIHILTDPRDISAGRSIDGL